MNGPVRTIFLGSGEFAVPSLSQLSENALTDVVAVLTAPPRPAGRKGEPRATPVAEAAGRLGLHVRTPTRLRDADVEAELAALRPALMVLADYGRLIPAELLALPAHGALNLHPSLLPRHRGASPVPATILAGDVATGVTLMRMDEGLDTGPIVAQRSVPLEGDEVAPELEARLAGIAAELLAEALPGWLDGSTEAHPQPLEGATLTRPLRREDGLLDADRPAEALERQVRAYQPWPGSFLETEAGRLIVWAARPGRSLPDAPIGAIVAEGDGIALASSSGLLVLDEVQPAGKRRMSGAEYRRGRPLGSAGA